MSKNVKRMFRWVLITALVVVLVLIGAVPMYVINSISEGHRNVEVYKSEDIDLESNQIELVTEDGLKLAAWEVNVDNPKGTIILLSGIDNPSVTAFFGYSKLLKEIGYSSLLIEMRGHGESEGGHISFGYEEYKDVFAGVDHIKENNDKPIILMGTSMGGATAINAFGKREDIDGLISISSYSSIVDMSVDFMENEDLPNYFISIEKPIFNIYLKFKYGEDSKLIPKESIKNIGDRPVLLMHSKGDTQVKYENFEKILENVPKNSNVETYVVEGDYHFVNRSTDINDLDVEFIEAIYNYLDGNF